MRFGRVAGAAARVALLVLGLVALGIGVPPFVWVLSQPRGGNLFLLVVPSVFGPFVLLGAAAVGSVVIGVVTDMVTARVSKPWGQKAQGGPVEAERGDA